MRDHQPLQQMYCADAAVPDCTLRNSTTITVIERLQMAIDSIEACRWEDAVLGFKRPVMEARAVSWSFIHEYRRALEALKPACGIQLLNSYMIQGSKSLDCRHDSRNDLASARNATQVQAGRAPHVSA